jgi:large subunit ribosomal protein L6
MTDSGIYNVYVTPNRFSYSFNRRRLCGARCSYIGVKTPLRALLFKIPTNVRVSMSIGEQNIYFMCIKKRYRTLVHSLADLIRATVGGGLHAYRVIMEVRGLGYKVFITQQDRVDLRLGFSHMVYFKLRNRMYAKAMGIKSRVFAIFGYDLIQVTAVAAHIRTMRRINVYKGKGIFKKYFKYKVKEGKRKKN